MAGNRKPNRKPGNRPSVVERMDRGIYAKAKTIAQRETLLIRMRNALPMGHEVNQHKIDLTFGAIEGYLREQEQTGESMVNERGEPVVIDPVDGTMIPAGRAFKNQHAMFCALAEKHGWGTVPDGLRRMGAKLDADMILFDSDMSDARVALDWMRHNIASISPNQWSEALDYLIEQEKIQAEKAVDDERKCA